MITSPKKLDTFSKNILLVFFGSTLLNVFSLLYQLLIAHRLSPADFASFNSLLAIFMLISGPISNLQPALTKYIAEYNARGELKKSGVLLSVFLKIALVLAACTSILFLFFSARLLQALKIGCAPCGYLVSALLGFTWLVPVFLGALQGFELFIWIALSAAITGVAKLLFAVILVVPGQGVSGALWALLFSMVIGMAISILPVGNLFHWRSPTGETINLKDVLAYLVPVTVSSFCFMALVSFDMVMVKYFFNPSDSGAYSFAQMIGKVFLFLPSSITIVLFPRAAGLNAKKLSTIATLKRSLLYAAILSLAALLAYNIFPAFVLKVLTGKALPESIYLGRFFSVSMTFWTLLNILIFYFLSTNDLRFIKYLLIFTAAQFLAIAVFHATLVQVQLIICLNSAALFFIHFFLAKSKKIEAVTVTP